MNTNTQSQSSFIVHPVAYFWNNNMFFGKQDIYEDADIDLDKISSEYISEAFTEYKIVHTHRIDDSTYQTVIYNEKTAYAICLRMVIFLNITDNVHKSLKIGDEIIQGYKKYKICPSNELLGKPGYCLLRVWSGEPEIIEINSVTMTEMYMLAPNIK